MDSRDRVGALLVIWVTFAVTAVATFWNKNTLGLESIIIAVVYAVAALAATGFVMSPPVTGTAEKTKNRKVERLLSSLNEEEMDALRQRLSDDGELISLEDALHQRKERP